MDERRLLGRRVKELRRDRGWSQEELAERMGIAPSYVSGIERGQSNPTLDLLINLSRAMKVELVALFNFSWLALSEDELRKTLLAAVRGADTERLRDMLALLKARERSPLK